MTQPINPSTGSDPNYTPPPTTGSSTLPNYGTIPTAGKALPTDSSGALDIWNLPAGVGDQSIWFDTGYGKQGNEALHGNGSKEQKTGMAGNGSFNINLSGDEVMKQYAAMSQNDPNGFMALQKLLALGSWYGPGTTKIQGGWNIQTENALAQAITQYLKVNQGAGVAVNFRTFLNNAVTANNATGGGDGSGAGTGTGTGAPTVPLTDPDTLTMYAQRAAQAALGRSLKPDEVQKFVDEFHTAQVGAYQTAVTGGKGTIVEKNDARASAIGFVTDNNQQEFQTHQTQGYADAFANMFLPQGSAAPNVNVDPSAVSY